MLPVKFTFIVVQQRNKKKTANHPTPLRTQDSLPSPKGGLTSAKTFVILTFKFVQFQLNTPVSPMIEFLFEFFCYSLVQSKLQTNKTTISKIAPSYWNTHTYTPKPIENTSFYFQIATSKQARNLYIFLFFFIVSANEQKHNNKHKIAKKIVRLGVVFNLTSKSIYVETKKVKQIFTFEHYFFKQHTQHYLTKNYILILAFFLTPPSKLVSSFWQFEQLNQLLS